MAQQIPQHIAIIMDGNGRWAKQKNLPRMAGHHAGMKAMKEIVKHCSQLGVKHLTVYAFSTENWKRSVEEVGGIFQLLVFFVDKELKELHENQVRVHILGDYSKLPKDAVERIEKTLETTRENQGLVFNIALNYGARWDLVSAVRQLAEKVEKGELSAQEIDEEWIAGTLSTGKFEIPDPDFVIRTSGEMRLSNFLLWESAYSELVFSPVLWPEFTPQDLDHCISEFQSRQRRYGGRCTEEFEENKG
jgi:undecaprenyl diphosphate synthase